MISISKIQLREHQKNIGWNQWDVLSGMLVCNMNGSWRNKVYRA